MKVNKENDNVDLQKEKGTDYSGSDAELDKLRKQIKDAELRMNELASHILPFTPEQIHTIISGNHLSQFEYRRRCDHHLLTFCLCLLALMVSTMWHTVPMGLSTLNVVLVAVTVADVWVAMRAAYSLWLMQSTLRLRPYPYRMARCADRLARLSHRRRLWLHLILRGTYTHSESGFIWQELFSVRFPSYSTAACFLLFLAVHSGTAFATTRDYVKVTTTTESSDITVCNTVNNLMAHL